MEELYNIGISENTIVSMLEINPELRGMTKKRNSTKRRNFERYKM